MSCFGNSWNILTFFISVFVRVICDLWCYSCNRVLGAATNPVHRGQGSLSINVCVLPALPTSRPRSLSFLGPPFSLRHNNIEIRLIKNFTVVSRCSRERESHMSFTWNQKLIMPELHEESMLRAETGRKPGLLAKQWMQKKVPEGRWRCLGEHTNGKTALLLVGKMLIWTENQTSHTTAPWPKV